MFEFSMISVITLPTIWFLVAFRVFIIGQHYSTFNIIWMSVWLVALNIINIFKSYTRCCIALE
ncbi:hypothetical protein KKH82_02590 [Patescibacteria group bacterium]|nr:hypothetical protein [Patescibacteria group bacterium]